MFVEKLTLKNFRKYKELEVDLADATTDEVTQMTWMNWEQIKEQYVCGYVGILLYGSI